MMINRIFRFLHRQIFGRFDEYLNSCHGILHIGANTGQERDHYQALGLHVVWVEPIPSIYDTLQRNVREYAKQRAIMALVADHDDQNITLNVASNGGASSSIFAMAGHKDLWPDVHYVDQMTLKSVTLPTLVQRENIDLSNYDVLLLDTQGAEFPILKGAESLLKNFRFIQVEAADFEAYAGAAKRGVIVDYLDTFGFRLKREQAIAKSNAIGGYFDLLFERR